MPLAFRATGPLNRDATMKYVCDAGDATWFRIETPGEATIESRDTNHAVAKYFLEAYAKAEKSYVPPKSARYVEQNIGLKDHVQRTMPIFLTLRDKDGNVLVTAMLPPAGLDERAFRPIVVGPANSDPFAEHDEAIEALAEHYDLTLDPARCYPYRKA